MQPRAYEEVCRWRIRGTTAIRGLVTNFRNVPLTDLEIDL